MGSRATRVLPMEARQCLELAASLSTRKCADRANSKFVYFARRPSRNVRSKKYYPRDAKQYLDVLNFSIYRSYHVMPRVDTLGAPH